jgi:hypothetical protein
MAYVLGLLSEGRRQVLAPGADGNARLLRGKPLDDVAFLGLVEQLVGLNLVDFLAVFQAARYRRRFEEKGTEDRIKRLRVMSYQDR